MMRVSQRWLRSLWLSGCLLLAVFSHSLAAEIKGVHFADAVVVDQTELHLKGVAVLKWAMLFDVYAGAFYLPAGISGQAWPEDFPKRLELSYFRAIKAQDFCSSSDKLLKSNLSPTEYQTVAERLNAFCGLFRDVQPGDRYSLTYRPDFGTELSLNQQRLGSVPGADFAEAYFGIWLGEKPISAHFRDQLLSDD